MNEDLDLGVDPVKELRSEVNNVENEIEVDKAIDTSQRFTESEEAFLRNPQRNSNVWVASCRNARTLDFFSKRLLLYQPDLRNFCHRGPDCPYQDNERHCALYTHLRRPHDKGATILEEESPLKGKKTKVRIPHIAKAWDLGSATSHLKDSAEGSGYLTKKFEGIPQNKIFFVICHGFNEKYPRIVTYLLHLLSKLGVANDNQNELVNLLAFTWPSQSVPASYYRARYMAQQAGKLLRRTLQILTFHGNKIILLAHSMGCRVALHALQDWNRSNKLAKINSLFLIAAGVAADDLSDRGNFQISTLGVDTLRVFYSKNDEMLQQGFSAAEFMSSIWNMRLQAMKPMGVVGNKGAFKRLTDSSPKLTSFDCSEEVKGHSIHLYLRSKQFWDALQQTAAPLIATSLLAKY